eukprot:3285583-Pyramimonas_sp.AAC.1
MRDVSSLQVRSSDADRSSGGNYVRNSVPATSIVFQQSRSLRTRIQRFEPNRVAPHIPLEHVTAKRKPSQPSAVVRRHWLATRPLRGESRLLFLF